MPAGCALLGSHFFVFCLTTKRFEQNFDCHFLSVYVRVQPRVVVVMYLIGSLQWCGVNSRDTRFHFDYHNGFFFFYIKIVMNNS